MSYRSVSSSLSGLDEGEEDEYFNSTKIYTPIIEPLHYDEADLNIIQLASNHVTTHSIRSSLSDTPQSSISNSTSFSNFPPPSNTLKTTITFKQPLNSTTTIQNTTATPIGHSKSNSQPNLIIPTKKPKIKKNMDSFLDEINNTSPNKSVPVVVTTAASNSNNTINNSNTSVLPTSASMESISGSDKLKEIRSIKKEQKEKEKDKERNKIKPIVLKGSNTASSLSSTTAGSLPSSIGSSSISSITQVDSSTINSLHRQQSTLSSIQHTHNIFEYEKPVIGEKTKEFVVCLKRVLIDKDQIMERNDHSLKTVTSKLFITIKKLHKDGSLRVFFEDLRLITEIVIRSGYFLQIFRSFFKLMDEVKNSEVFFSFLGECRKMADIVNLIIKSAGNENQTRKMIYIEEDHRRILLKQIKFLIQILLRNEELISLVKNISYLKKQVDIAKEEQRKTFPYSEVKENLKYAPFTNEVLGAAQSIVGEKINIRSIFKNIHQAALYVQGNSKYRKTVQEFTEIIRKIYSTEESNLNVELETKTRQSMDRLETMIIEICSLSFVVEARVQLSLLISSFCSDPINARIINDFKDLFHGIKSDEPGKRIDFKVVKELKLLIFPYLIHNIHKISIPNIASTPKENGKKNKVDYRLEDINIVLTKIDPNCFKVKLISQIETAPLTLTGCMKSILEIELTNIQFRLNQVRWFYKKHSFPKIKDDGLVNISTGEKGVDVKVKISFSPKIIEEKHCFQILKSKCKIHDIRIEILNSNHNSLYKTIYKLFKKKIRASIEEAIVEAMKEKIKELDLYMYDLFFDKDAKVDKTQNIKSLTKAKRDKILERIVTELPTSAKSSRRFSILSLNFNQNGAPTLPTPTHSRKNSSASENSIDNEIEEFLKRDKATSATTIDPLDFLGDSSATVEMKNDFLENRRKAKEKNMMSSAGIGIGNSTQSSISPATTNLSSNGNFRVLPPTTINTSTNVDSPKRRLSQP
ncbi:hypothetical protein CYY_002591 [Polysphondylium violaceum]|uniref:HAM1-like N-terminal domain-containing protein n=1 Tax=Polysphondylium violaceum TaxID=133409 RepID=A0A8J4PZX9_9MYCE|nr:hypothetical protein CYY_002591 [Polysphondylium violaceum]